MDGFDQVFDNYACLTTGVGNATADFVDSTERHGELCILVEAPTAVLEHSHRLIKRLKCYAPRLRLYSVDSGSIPQQPAKWHYI